VAAVVVLAGYFLSTQLSVNVGDLTASISGMEISDGNLRMVNPTLKGTNKSGGKYVVSADYADQDIKDPKIVRLHAIKAEVLNPSGAWSRMNATRGVFDSRAERLVMQDKITLATSSNVSGELKHASLDMPTQTLRSHRPVFFDLPNGRITANALTLRSSANQLIFRGKVRVHLVKPKEDQADAARTSQAGAPAQEVQEEMASPVAEGALPQETAIPELPAMPQ
jgi:lipopolysaccharide export system protein LptC